MEDTSLSIVAKIHQLKGHRAEEAPVGRGAGRGAAPRAKVFGGNIHTTTRSAGVGRSGPPRTLGEVARMKVTIWHPEHTPSSGRACQNIPATRRQEVFPLLPKAGALKTGFIVLRASS